ncbi:hypothetical protein I7I51_02976, partial [Histoplasma capsulatum]
GWRGPNIAAAVWYACKRELLQPQIPHSLFRHISLSIRQAQQEFRRRCFPTYQLSHQREEDQLPALLQHHTIPQPQPPPQLPTPPGPCRWVKWGRWMNTISLSPSLNSQKISDNPQVNKWVDSYLGIGEWVMDQSVAVFGSSGYFERRR